MKTFAEIFNEEVAHLELQDFSGVWRRVETTRANLQLILQKMKQLKQSAPAGYRVRAVDDDGRILDIL
jgi:hypothetical protein